MNSEQQDYPKMVNFEYQNVPSVTNNTGSQPVHSIEIPQYDQPIAGETVPAGYKQRAVTWVKGFKRPKLAKSEKSKKRLRCCTKCHVMTGYLMVILSAINFLPIAIALFTTKYWSHVSLTGTNGARIDLEVPKSVYLLFILKTLLSVILYKIGRDAIRTFKPVVADIKKEEAEGIVSTE
jgi:hypothetical protein